MRIPYKHFDLEFPEIVNPPGSGKSKVERLQTLCQAGHELPGRVRVIRALAFVPHGNDLEVFKDLMEARGFSR